MTGDDDDDLDWEEWMSMTDAQQDAVVERENRELARATDRMTPAQLYASMRRNWLENCLSWRRLALCR